MHQLKLPDADNPTCLLLHAYLHHTKSRDVTHYLDLRCDRCAEYMTCFDIIALVSTVKDRSGDHGFDHFSTF